MSGVEKALKKCVSVSQVYSRKSQWRGPEFVQNALKPGVEIDVETSVEGKKKKVLDLTVITLAGRKYVIECDAKKTTERNILPTILAHEGIGGPERLFFGLARLRKGDMVFLEPEVPLSKYLDVGEDGPCGEDFGGKTRKMFKNVVRSEQPSVEVLTLFVRFRVYVLPDVFGASRLVHLLYLQARHDVMEGSIMLAKAGDMFELASLAMQAEIGDVGVEDNAKLDYFLLAHYLPTELPELRREDDTDLKRKLAGHHRKWRGVSKEEAERRFLGIASKENQFGQQFFTAEWNSLCNAADVDVGVNQEGIFVWTIVPRVSIIEIAANGADGDGHEFSGVSRALPSSTRRLRLGFPWNKIEKVSYDSKRVVVKTFQGCEGELPRKFKFKPLNISNWDFFFVAHTLHDFNVRLKQGLGRLLLSRQVWGVPESVETSRISSADESRTNHVGRKGLCDQNGRQAVVLSPENRVVPLFRSNSNELLDKENKAAGGTKTKKLLTRHQSEYFPRPAANPRSTPLTNGSNHPRPLGAHPKYITRICINTDSSQTTSTSKAATTNFARPGSSASVSTSTTASTPSPVPASGALSSSTSDSGVCESDEVSQMSTVIEGMRKHRSSRRFGSISMSMIANWSRVPILDSEPTVDDADDTGEGEQLLEEANVTVQEVQEDNEQSEKQPEDGVPSSSMDDESEVDLSVSRTSERGSPELELSQRSVLSMSYEMSSTAVAKLLRLSDSNMSGAEWNWQDESVSQSLLERFAQCGIGPERKIMRVVLHKEEDDLRPWGILITEKGDKSFYVCGMPFISVAAKSGLIKEGDRLLHANGKDLTGLTFCDVLKELNPADGHLDLVISRQVVDREESNSVIEC